MENTIEDTILEVKVNQGENLRTIRNTLKVKQESLAQKLGISQQTISKHENSRVLDDKVIDKYAKLLNVPARLIKYLPENKEGRQMVRDLRISSNKDSKFTFADQITNYFCDDDIINMMKDNMRLFKDECEKLKTENEKLRNMNEILKDENEMLKKKVKEESDKPE